MATPPDDRLYGRRRGHTLRARQQRLLDQTLPRLRFHPGNAWAGGVSALWVEVGFGAGEHAQALVAAAPAVGLIACEVFRNGICSLLGRLVGEGAEATGALPDNLRLWDGDARALLRLLPDASLDGLVLMFPDPWPKNRHEARRFVNVANVALVARVLKPGGVWRVASDDPTYQAWVGAVMGSQDLFEGEAPSETRPAGWPATRYEQKALRAGRQPMYWVFTRRERREGNTPSYTGRR